MKNAFSEDNRYIFKKHDKRETIKEVLINTLYHSPSSPNREWKSPENVISGFDIGMSQMAIGSDGTIACTDKCVSDIKTNTVSFTDFALSSPDVWNLMSSLYRACRYVADKYVQKIDNTLFRLMENMIRNYDFTMESMKDSEYLADTPNMLFGVMQPRRYEKNHPVLQLPQPVIRSFSDDFKVNDSGKTNFTKDEKNGNMQIWVCSYQFAYSDNDVYGRKEKPEIRTKESTENRIETINKIRNNKAPQNMNTWKDIMSKEHHIMMTRSADFSFFMESVIAVLATAVNNSGIDLMKETESIRTAESPEDYPNKFALLMCRDLIALSLLLKRMKEELKPEEKEYANLYLEGSSPLIMASSGLEPERYEDIVEFDIAYRKDEAVQYILSGDFEDSSAKDVLEYLRILLENGANINAKNYDDWTPFHTAMEKEKKIENIFELAAETGKVEIMTYIMESLSENIIGHFIENENKDRRGNTILYNTFTSEISEYPNKDVITVIMKCIGLENLDSYLEYDKKLSKLLKENPEKMELWKRCEQIVLANAKIVTDIKIGETKNNELDHEYLLVR